MPVVKRILFYAFIVVSFAAAVWGYLNLKQSKEPVVLVQEHIPNTVLCIIESQSAPDLINQLTRQNLVWNALLQENTIQKSHHCISYLDSLFKSSEEVKAALDGTRLFCSFFKENDRVKNLLQFKLNEQKDASIFESFFGKAFKRSASVASFDAYELSINNNVWLVCLNQGIIYLASDFDILEAAINLEKAKSIASNGSYQDLVKLNGGKETLIYFNHRYSDLFDKSLFNQQSVFGVELQLNAITCNGYSRVDSTSFLSLLQHQKAHAISQYEHLPDGAISIIGIGLNNVGLFYKNLINQTVKTLKTEKLGAWKSINDSALYDIQKEFFENIDDEIVSGSYWVNDTACSISSIKIKDFEKQLLFAKVLSDTVVSLNSFYLVKLPRPYRTIFSFFDAKASNEYLAFNEESVFLFSNKKAMDLYFNALNNSDFLGKNSAFMNYARQNLAQESNFIYFENCKGIHQTTISRFFNSQVLNTADDILSKLSLTIKSDLNGLQFRLNAVHGQIENSNSTNSSSLWTFSADSAIQTPVYVFTNHLTKENELCFQDNLKQIYLMSATGKLLWKKSLNENVQSKIYTVDIFKNGKLQLLFNTENYIHLLDRNGAYVQGYPVKMPAKISSSITLLDYDNNKDYRLFMACVDKKIYNYSLYGVSTEGYTPLRTDAMVTLPIKYLKIGPSDYLVTADVNGKPYVFSRKGEGRIDFKNVLPENVNQIFVLSGNNLDNTKIICLDSKNNHLVKLSLTDKKESLKVGDNVEGFNSSFALVNDDTQEDMLTFGSGALYAYDFFTNQLLECFNDQAVYSDVQVVNTSNHQWILALDKASQKIDLINTQGKIIGSIGQVSQKPLCVRLYKDDKTYLILVNGKTLSCQRLN